MKPTDELREFAQDYGTGEPGDPWGHVDRLADLIDADLAHVVRMYETAEERRDAARDRETRLNEAHLELIGTHERIKGERDEARKEALEYAGEIERLDSLLAAAEKELAERMEQVEGLLQRQDEIIVACGSLGLMPSEIAEKVGRLRKERDDARALTEAWGPSFALADEERAEVEKERDAMRERVKALEGALEKAPSLFLEGFEEARTTDDIVAYEKAVRDWIVAAHAALHSPAAPPEPDLGEPTPPLACPECGWEWGAKEPAESEPEAGEATDD